MKRLLFGIAVAIAAMGPSLAQITEAQGISHRLSGLSNGDTMAQRTVFRSSGTVLRATRGVLLQSLAGFARQDNAGQWSKVPETQVRIQKAGDGYCLRIGFAACAPIPMSSSEVVAVRDFVVKGRKRAITLASDAKDYQAEAEKIAADYGMAKTTGMAYPEVWISRSFLGNEMLQARLEALDFMPIFTSELNSEELSKYRTSLNATLGSAPISEAEAADASWIVSDLGANLVIYTEGGALRCAGYPTRAHWRIGAAEHARVWKVEALGLSAEARKEAEAAGDLGEVQGLVSAGRWMVCTTAMLRALHKFAPGSLDAIQ